jgi:hypothetical protein
MFKNLLVHIPTERSPRPAIDGSISLAMTFGADLEAVAVGYESVNHIPFVAQGGVAMAPIFEVQHEQAVDRANGSLAVFEVEAKAAKVNYKCRALGASFAEAVAIFNAKARLSDLTIVSQPAPGYETYDNLFPQTVLLEAGGPIVVVPYTSTR